MKLGRWFGSYPQRLLFVVGFCLYLTALPNQFVWDDEFFFVNNVYMNSWQDWPNLWTQNTLAGAGQLSNYYRPLTSQLLAIDKLIWGSSPLGFHLNNAVLHALAGVVLYEVLLLLGLKKWPAGWISLIFLVHPVQVQAVAYMASRGDSLFVLLLLSSLWLLLKSFDTRAKQSIISLSLANCLLIMALLAKEVAVAGVGLWLLVVLHKWVVIKQNLFVKFKPQLISLLVAIGSVLVYLELRFSVLYFTSAQAHELPELYYKDLTVRLLTFTKSFWLYLKLLLWPYPLHFYRVFPLITTINWWPVSFVAALIGVSYLGYREWRHRHSIWIWFGVAWFLGLLVPVSGVLPVNGLMYEHWLYLPQIGFWLVVYGVIVLLKPHLYWQITTSFGKGLALVIVLLSLLTVIQIGLWRDNLTVYAHNLRYNQHQNLHNNQGLEYLKLGNFHQAKYHFNQAISIAPTMAQPYYNLALIGKVEQDTLAIEENLLQSLEAEPSYFLARRELISYYLTQKQYAKAKAQAQVLSTQTPNDWQVWQALAIIAQADGNTQELEHYQQKLSLLKGN